MILDLRKGFGDFDDYKLFKFPDGSIKFQLKKLFDTISTVITTLKSSEDLWILGLVSDVISRMQPNRLPVLHITYMMYQQDDRRFAEEESFGLRVAADFINTLKFSKIEIFAPHSDKVELIKNCVIIDNTFFISKVLDDIKQKNTTQQDPVWIIPDSGAFKTQFKQIEKLHQEDFIVCMKSRDPKTGALEQIVNSPMSVSNRDLVIFDDICLGGRTFIGIAEALKRNNLGDYKTLSLAVSHGIFNNGFKELNTIFDNIYTTDSYQNIGEFQHDGINLQKTNVTQFKIPNIIF